MDISALNALTKWHVKHCKPYRNFISTFFAAEVGQTLADIPFLPVRAFKEFELRSVPEESIFKTMTSSGTSGQFSQIFLDKETAQMQSRALIDIFGKTFSSHRFPMLIMDTESTIKDRQKFSARTTAINGFSLFSRERCFALNNDLTLNLERVRSFVEAQDGKPIFIFGFTFMVWKYFIEPLRMQSHSLKLENSFLLHGGGWKKMEAERVTADKFRSVIKDVTGCQVVRNYYGMVEQAGTIFMECAHGNLHAADNSDVIIRDPETHVPLPHGVRGLVQVFSGIQKSYPGHSLLTEDIGVTQPAHSCPCGHQGTVIEIYGRLKKAEVRGCSDAYT